MKPMLLNCVMAGLDPWAFSPRTCSVGIHEKRHVDARIKSGHDDIGVANSGDHNV
jgi:hypothetical protein